MRMDSFTPNTSNLQENQLRFYIFSIIFHQKHKSLKIHRKYQVKILKNIEIFQEQRRTKHMSKYQFKEIRNRFNEFENVAYLLNFSLDSLILLNFSTPGLLAIFCKIRVSKLIDSREASWSERDLI